MSGQIPLRAQAFAVMPPLPPAAEAARLAAVRQQNRRNMFGGFLVCSFVAGVFTYVVNAVDQEQVTERELQEFKEQRARSAAAQR